jgi:hypothetical protein
MLMRQGWITNSSGNKRHYVDGKVHSINDEPAIIWINGLKAWCKEGRYHRELGPAYIRLDGYKAYYFENGFYPEITSDLEWMLKVEELKKNLT